MNIMEARGGGAQPMGLRRRNLKRRFGCSRSTGVHRGRGGDADIQRKEETIRLNSESESESQQREAL